MDTTRSNSELWFADSTRPFLGPEPFFYEPGEFDWVRMVEARWQVIRDELAAFVGARDGQQDPAQGLVPYMDVTMASRRNQWKTLGLMFWTLRSRNHCRKFPRTWEILKRIPNITGASFNLLEARTTIRPHIGNTNAIIRCHLGLSIPDSVPRCGFRVGSEMRSWQEGKLLMFCDAHEHTAWNNTGEQRYILVIDIMRKEFGHKTLATSSRVLASIHHSAALQRSAWLRTVCRFAWSDKACTGLRRGLIHLRLAIRDVLGRASMVFRARQAENTDMEVTSS